MSIAAPPPPRVISTTEETISIGFTSKEYINSSAVYYQVKSTVCVGEEECQSDYTECDSSGEECFIGSLTPNSPYSIVARACARVNSLNACGGWSLPTKAFTKPNSKFFDICNKYDLVTGTIGKETFRLT